MLLYIVRHGDPDYTTDTLTMRRAIPYVETATASLKDSDINTRTNIMICFSNAIRYAIN